MQRSRSKLTPSLVLTLAGVTVLFSGCLRMSSNCEDDGIDCPATGGKGGTGGATAGTGGKAGGGKGGEAAGGATAGSGGSEGGTAAQGGGGATGGGDAGGGAGGMVSSPCDGACKAPKPVCDEPSDTCVECLKETDCTSSTKKKCDTTAKACVQCLAPSDCPSATAAKCDAGTCSKCTSNDDCAHVAGKTVCNMAAGECVQCTATDETSCAGKSCNPATKTCTTTPTGSVDTCGSCVADSECIGGNKADPDSRCVPMNFAGSPRPDGFCLRREAKTCGRPYTIAISAKSLSEAPAESYCGIDQQNVTCEAVLDLIGDVDGTEACADGNDASCGCVRDLDDNCSAAGKGGLCRKVGTVNNRCTYRCGIGDHCPEGLSCTGSPTKFCQ